MGPEKARCTSLARVSSVEAITTAAGSPSRDFAGEGGAGEDRDPWLRWGLEFVLQDFLDDFRHSKQ